MIGTLPSGEIQEIVVKKQKSELEDFRKFKVPGAFLGLSKMKNQQKTKNIFEYLEVKTTMVSPKPKQEKIEKFDKLMGRQVCW